MFIQSLQRKLSTAACLFMFISGPTEPCIFLMAFSGSSGGWRGHIYQYPISVSDQGNPRDILSRLYVGENVRNMKIV